MFSPQTPADGKSHATNLEQLDLSLLDNSFADKPHDVFVIYDEVVDEFIIKIKKPSSPTTVYHYADKVALVVELKNLQVVGIILFDFTKEHLPKMSEFKRTWEAISGSKYFKHYQTLHYQPQECKKTEIDNIVIRTQKVFDSKRELVFA